MLNIPEEVKQLFRKGSTKKNLRIHFPNGEREDITNSNIIAESFSFTESICSQDTLKFGLCEASMVEFETFNIGNIKGCTIEITLDVLNGQEWYPIPMGTYVVDSCEKQSNMTRRRVKAYSKEFIFEKMSALEIGKRNQIAYHHSSKKYYDYDLFKFIASNYFNGNEDFLVKSNVSTRKIILQMSNNELEGGYSWKASFEVNYYNISSEESLKSLYYINNDFNKTGVVKALKKKLEEKVTEWAALYYSGYYDSKNLIDSIVSRAYPFVTDYSPYSGISINDDNKLVYMYPYGYDIDFDTFGDYGIYVPYSCSISLYENYLNEKDSATVELSSDPEIYSIDTSQWNEFTVKETGDFVNKHMDFRESTEAYLELMGVLGKRGRTGEFDFISLKSMIGLYPSETLYPSNNLYPSGNDVLITKTMYKNAWYDDFYTPIYSKVTCTYKNSETNENTYAEHVILEVEAGEEDKYQIYDISDNYLIKENTFTEEQITEILSNIALNIEGVRYMPADIDLIGLPYLEAGDVVRVITTDGGFETIILNRTLSGIQRLNDNYESRG